jgi:4-hydroxy-3-methylbut-2-enyl diphosphate reductase
LKIIVAKTAGYCYGVRRATEMAFEAVRNAKGPIYSLGEIIHNPQVVSQLEESGVRLVRDVKAIRGGTAIIPAHGRTASDVEYLRKRGVPTVDATCPHVRLPQRAIADLAAEGCPIIFLGDPAHPEVRAVSSYARGAEVMFVTDVSELPALRGVKKVGVIAQTTQSAERFRALVSELKARIPSVLVRDTICSATRRRQEEAEKLSGRADTMIVIGGRLSANTKRLAEICRKNCRITRHVESAGELEGMEFDSSGILGITAGASTPEWVIAEVLEKLNSIDGGG